MRGTSVHLTPAARNAFLAPLWLCLVACQPRVAGTAGVSKSSARTEADGQGSSATPLATSTSNAAASIELSAPPAILLSAAPSDEAANLPARDGTLKRAAVSQGGSPTPTASDSASKNTALNNAAASPHAKPRRFVVAFMGDSLTDYASGGGYIRYLREKCPTSQFDNYGVGGNMTNQMRRRFQRDVVAPNKPLYSHVVIFGGVNDLISNLTAHRTNPKIISDLTQMYAWAHGAGIRTVALTVAPWGGLRRYFSTERGENTRALNQWILSQVGGLVDAVVETGPLLSCDNPFELCPEYVPPFNDGIHFGKPAHLKLGEALHAAVFSPCL